MSVEMAQCALMHLIPDVCHVLRILAVAVCRIGDVCCLPAPAHQPFSFNSLGLIAPEVACSRNVRVSGTLKFGYEGICKKLHKLLHITYCWNSVCLFIQTAFRSEIWN